MSFFRSLSQAVLAPLFVALICTWQPTLTLTKTVAVSRGPGEPWIERETRTLADLPKFKPDRRTNRYGGKKVGSRDRTGFFHTDFVNGRWWLKDPDGMPYVARGVTSIKMTKTKGAKKKLIKKFGSPEKWASSAVGLLKENGFNGVGPWSQVNLFDPSELKIAYTPIWNFMGNYGQERGGTRKDAGHRGYPGECPFIFDPEFAEFCDRHAEQLVKTKDDPWLLGHFTDNELPWHINMLDRYLDLPQDDPGYQAARKWVRDNKIKKPFGDRDRARFVSFAADKYFGIVCGAIRKHDPNHLILGSRFHGSCLRIPELFEAAGQHIDVVSVNYYRTWTPEKDRMKGWAKASGKPILITEWYAKGIDSGLGNTSGAGWLVKTQQDRADFYQNFTLGLLESRVCVGWHWFRYSDNDPNQKGADPSNLDANKGIVTSDYEPYETLLETMKEINQRCYRIVDHFDRRK